MLDYNAIPLRSVAKISPALVLWSSFCGLLCPIDISPSVCAHVWVWLFVLFGFVSTSLLSGTTRCFRVIAGTYFPIPRTSYFLESCFLIGEWY